ncbi:MAG: dihydrodipicolinate synthase family protein [Candidatus Latescibacterota bacterium]
MSAYDELRRRIAGPTVPLPMFYTVDGSVDYPAIERYVTWILDAGIRNTCLTYAYSQIGFLSADELSEVTRVVADAVGHRAVFIACTREGTAAEGVAAVRELQRLGAHAAFVMPNLMTEHGVLYRDHLRCVAAQAELPLLFVSYPSPGQPGKPNLAVADFDLLLEHETIVGLKEDNNSVPYRLELVRRYGDRLCIIGGGVLRNYFHFHAHPGQGELDGMFHPARALHLADLLRGGRLQEALDLIDEQERAFADSPSSLYWLERNQAVMHVLGPAPTCTLRPPLQTPSRQHVEAVRTWVRRHPSCFQAL